MTAAGEIVRISATEERSVEIEVLRHADGSANIGMRRCMDSGEQDVKWARLERPAVAQLILSLVGPGAAEPAR